MSKQGFDLSGYTDVAQRVKLFYEKYPEGSLQATDPHNCLKLVTVGEQQFVVYTALAYRTADDPRPGQGTAWEPVPGKTPYTRDSEAMNAETSAWGRAIGALGIGLNDGVASREEVRNRQSSKSDPKQQVSDDAMGDFWKGIAGMFPDKDKKERGRIVVNIGRELHGKKWYWKSATQDELNVVYTALLAQQDDSGNHHADGDADLPDPQD